MSIKNITTENFASYGTVLEFPEDNHEPFYIVDTEEEAPWRVAVFRFRNKEIKLIENHPTSKETFEPYLGASLLLVAENATPEKYEVFYLDKAVCLKKGIWHQTLALSEEATVKITENLEVDSKYYEFEVPLKLTI